MQFKGPALPLSLSNLLYRDDIVVVLSKTAAAKIDRLLLSFNSEVGFYGIVNKYSSADEVHTYYRVDDILVYPQIVSHSSVTTNDIKMAEFFMEHTEVINSIRYQGHSHVMMSTSPSYVDIELMLSLTETLKNPDDFYIFQIFNKSDATTTIFYKDKEFYKVPFIRAVDSDIDTSCVVNRFVESPPRPLQQTGIDFYSAIIR